MNTNETNALPDHSCIFKFIKMDRSGLTENEQFHVDVFLLSYYTGGSTINELASLKVGDVQDEYTYIKRGVSGEVSKVPNYGEYANIVKKYGDLCYGDYLLPIFTHKHITEEQQAGKVKRFSEQVNATLKKVAMMVGVKNDITISSVRRIFIELMLWSGTNFDHIAQSVGCSVETIFRHHERMVEISLKMEE